MGDNILSKNNFYKIIERERARSDRTGSDFSIIILEIPYTAKAFIDRLVHTIRGKIACYDDIGWLDKRTLGILSPHTEYDEALKLAADLASSKANGLLTCGYTVLTYPFHWTAPQMSTDESQVRDDSSYANVKAWALANDKLVKYLKLSPGIPLWKKMVDVVGAGTGLVLLLPVLILLALYIKIVSSGPIFFRQKRVGFLGKSFTCYKFRTMHVQSSAKVHNKYFTILMSKDIPMQKLDDQDSRIIPFGWLLRKTGLDELPQLFNVLKGDMSLIGPRPCIPYEAEEYKTWQRKRFDTLPGLTGLWQVSGKNKTTFNQMMRYDIRYAAEQNFFLDTKILLKTIPAIIDQFVENRKVRLFESIRGRA